MVELDTADEPEELEELEWLECACEDMLNGPQARPSRYPLVDEGNESFLYSEEND